MPGISTHVLDTARGRPAAGIGVHLDRDEGGGGWERLADAVTDADGSTPGPISATTASSPR